MDKKEKEKKEKKGKKALKEAIADVETAIELLEEATVETITAPIAGEDNASEEITEPDPTEEPEKKEEKDGSVWSMLDEETRKAVMDFAPGYIEFLNTAKTEREVTDFVCQVAAEHGFSPLEKAKKLHAGQKLLFRWKNKVSALIVIGEEPIENGCCLIASHADAPRIDLKANPAYEADGFALLKTHYYGGIRKYQWLAIPLALHGVVVKKDGSVININIGEKDEDPVFTITDLLPHLAQKQAVKKVQEFVSGEDLNLLIGSFDENNGKDPVKKQVLALLKEQYGIEEKDFTTAELEIVPAIPARHVGLDNSLIGGYGQDDRISVYTSLQAALEIENPKHTAITLFVDKEEIGSYGNTGLSSLLLETLYAELLHRTGKDDYYTLRKALNQSFALSADVNAAVDPNYPEVFEKMNCSFAGKGVVLTKFTGSRGKSGSNDANPEYMGALRALFDQHEAAWQIGELGKVDLGGGGTVALYLAFFGIETVDCGAALLGMHSPFEISSKVDVYMAYKAYKAFLQEF